MIEIINGKPKLVKKNKPYLTRQEAPKTFEMNASIYIWKRKYLLKNGNIISNKTICHYMPRERSIDIDNKIIEIRDLTGQIASKDNRISTINHELSIC